jgi:hypothetical protein
MAGAGGAMTGDEQRATINRRIDGSLQAYDRRIREAQDALDKEREKTVGESGGEAGGNTSAGSAGGAGVMGGGAAGAPRSAGGAAAPGGSAGGTGNSSASATSGGAAGRSGGASGGGSGPATVPGDISDGSDDDIVARQLREAAMKEKDAVLREKLWQEYRDYKKGAG